MTVKYLYKNKKPVALVWAEKKKEYAAGTATVIGITLLAVGLVAIAWWKLNQPQMKLSTCHTCGER